MQVEESTIATVNLQGLPDDLLALIFMGCGVRELGRLSQVRIKLEATQRYSAQCASNTRLPLLSLSS